MRKNNKHGKKPIIASILPFLILALILGAAISGKGLLKLWHLSGMLSSEKAVLEKTIALRDSLTIEKKRLLSDSLYIEEIARKDFGMMKKGEKVYNISVPSEQGAK